MTSELDIKTLELRECWDLFKVEIEQGTQEYQKARFGVMIKFDINDYFAGHIQIKAKTGKVFIKGRCHRSESFYTELENRERIMKIWLDENFGDEDIVNARK